MDKNCFGARRSLAIAQRGSLFARIQNWWYRVGLLIDKLPYYLYGIYYMKKKLNIKLYRFMYPII